MAKSFYGFDKIQGYSPVIDFKTVRTEIDTELDKINKAREEKKKTIEENTKAAMEALAKDEGMGQYEQLNNHVIGLTDQIKDNILIQNELLMSGRVRPSDYNKFVETSKSSIDNIHTFANKLQERAVKLQEDNVSGISIFLDSEFVNNEYLRNNSFFQNARGEIYMAGIDEDGNIKFDENGNILNKMSPASMTAVANMPIINETDFDAELDALWSKFGDITTNMTGEVIQTKVSAAIDEAHRKFGAMDDVEQLKFLEQETSNSRFELTRDREQAREANDKYMEVLGQMNEIRTKLKDEDLSDEESQRLTAELNALNSSLQSIKLYGYVNRTGDAGVIETELHPVHQVLINEIATSMINARIPETFLATQINPVIAQSNAEDKANGYIAGELANAIKLLGSGNLADFKAGEGLLTTILSGKGASSINYANDGEGNYYLAFIDENGYNQVVTGSVLDEASGRNFYRQTLNLLGLSEYASRADRTNIGVVAPFGKLTDGTISDDAYNDYMNGQSSSVTTDEAEEAIQEQDYGSFNFQDLRRQ